MHCGISNRQGGRPKIISSIIRNYTKHNVKIYLVIDRLTTVCGSKRHFVCDTDCSARQNEEAFCGQTQPENKTTGHRGAI